MTRFEDTLAKVLLDYRKETVAKRVTTAQLLTHRSGTGLYWAASFEGNWTAMRTTEDLLPYFIDEPLAADCGTKWFHSNTGYA